MLVSASLLRPPFVCPQDETSSGTRMNRPLEGLVCMNFRSEENLDLPGNCNVVASDFYVTFVYNGMFFKTVLITGILYVCLKMLCVNLRLTQPMLDWGESKAQLQNKTCF